MNWLDGLNMLFFLVALKAGLLSIALFIAYMASADHEYHRPRVLLAAFAFSMVSTCAGAGDAAISSSSEKRMRGEPEKVEAAP